jgi:hypothetical protein
MLDDPGTRTVACWQTRAAAISIAVRLHAVSGESIGLFA